MAAAALIVLLLDQITKLWIAGSMELGQATDVFSGFARLRLTHNKGAAFGIFADSTGILSIISLLVIVGIVVAFVRLGNPTRLSVLAAGLVVGGALGNLLDRLRLGYVVDFVEVYNPHLKFDSTVYTFPVFNVADSAITVGVVLILFGILFTKTEEKPAEGNAAPQQIAQDTPLAPGDPDMQAPAEQEAEPTHAAR